MGRLSIGRPAAATARGSRPADIATAMNASPRWELEKQRLQQQLQDTTQQLELDKLRLKQQLLVAMKKLYGPRGDRLTSEGDVAQLLLEFAAARRPRRWKRPISHPKPARWALEMVRRVKRRKGRRDLAPTSRSPAAHPQRTRSCRGSEGLPVLQPAASRPWPGDQLQIEYIPGSFQRIEHVRLKYALHPLRAAGRVAADHPGGQAGPADR